MLGKLHIYNPGNIRQSNDLFIGEIKPSSDAAFKEFASNAFGYRAMFKVLDTYRKYGIDSIDQIISRYSEDNVNQYVQFVSSRIGIAPNVTIPNEKKTMINMVIAMSRFENGVDAKVSEVEQGWSLKENIDTAVKVASGFGTIAFLGLIVILIKNLK
ncbi:MAG: structural protein P5 [Bacteroidota bacterium]